MKTLKLLRVSALAVLTLTVALLMGSPAMAQWVRVPNGQIPASALQGGNEANGTPIYIARATIEGGVHIGKVRQGETTAFIPYGGQERSVSNYEVYIGTGTWQEVRAGQRIPPNAIAGTDGADPFYIARATIEGGTHPGKAKGGEAWFPYGGQERYVVPFQVLVSSAVSNSALVTMYTNCEYGGESRFFRPGRYNWNQLGLPNDEVSSLKIPAGMSVKLYADSEFAGPGITVTSNVACLADQDFNDKTSSFEVFNGAVSTVRVDDIDEWLCPKAVVRGDREFDGHGPRIKCNVSLRIGDEGRALYAEIYFWAKETVHDWSETERRWSKKVYDAPIGKRITQIVSDRESRTQFISPAAGFQFLVPGSDVAATVNGFLDGVGGTITNVLLTSYGINPNDIRAFAGLITGAINNGNTVVRVPSVEGRLVKFFHIVGDTGGPDISDDDNCNDDTRIVKLEFNEVQVILR